MAPLMTVEDPVTRKRRKFRELLARKRLTVMPGGFSPLYARLAQEAGFECFFLAGSQLAAFLYGVPDNGIIGLRDLVDHARHMAARASIPIMVDGDTGYGGLLNVDRTVRGYAAAGASGAPPADRWHVLEGHPEMCGALWSVPDIFPIADWTFRTVRQYAMRVHLNPLRHNF